MKHWVLSAFILACRQLSVATSAFSAFTPRQYSLMNDGRCLFTNVSLASAPYVGDIQCAGLCNITVNCSMFMVATNASGKACYVYSGMTKRFYSLSSYPASPGSCKIYTSGWGSCPQSNYSFQGKFYYPILTKMTPNNAINVCTTVNTLPLKLDNWAEATYVAQLYIPAATGGLINWIGLRGNYSDGYLTWINDGTILNTTSLPLNFVWDLDNCCTPPISCWGIAPSGTGGKFVDNGCDDQVNKFYTTCTCQ